MPFFIYTATNNKNQTVTERIEADNTNTARYRLELQDYTGIEFYTDLMAHDTHKLFGNNKYAKQERIPPKNLLECYKENGLWRGLFRSIKTHTFIWLPLMIGLIYNYYQTSAFTIWSYLINVAAVVFLIHFTRINLPARIFDVIWNASIWAEWDKVRFWVKIANLANKIAVIPIPKFFLDVRLACADAAQGNLDEALLRLNRYKTDEKVTPYNYHVHLAMVYDKAKLYDKVIEEREWIVENGTGESGGLIDYAVTLVLHRKDTAKARELIEQAYEKEITVMARPFALYCKGIIEVEDKNYDKADFYLSEAMNAIAPFSKSQMMIGLTATVKVFQAITMAHKGNREQARKLFESAKPYLLANKKDELIERCQQVVG